MSKREYDSLQQDSLQLKNLQSSEVSHIAIDQSSTAPLALYASSNSSWIIDSRATDHMVGMFHLFSTLSPLSLDQMKLANGSFTGIVGKELPPCLLVLAYHPFYMFLIYHEIYCMLVPLPSH